METTNSNNPFLNQDYLVDTKHHYTSIDNIVDYPFKTLNRLLDDIKWSIPYRNYCNDKSLLNLKPIDYSKSLAGLVSSNAVKSEMLMLNNDVEYCKKMDILHLNDHNENQMMTIIRGLIVINRKVINHFRIQVLENKSPFFERKTNVTKFQYHVVPKDLISKDDLHQFGDDPSNLIDEAFAMTNNEDVNHLLRITIFSTEFDDDDLKLLLDPTIIKHRYLEFAKRENSQIDANVEISGLICIKKLISVLKGPITLEPHSQIKTIKLKETSLESLMDIDYLINKLSFILDDGSLIPPNLSINNMGLKESYVRKVLELIYRGKVFKNDNTNDFNTIYSFNDNLSVVFRTFNEFDKHLGQTYSLNNITNTISYLISLSCSDFFQDELIIKCFENTIRSDRDNQIFYVDDLKCIIKYKTSGVGKLRTYYDNLYRSGQLYGYSDYTDALNRLKIEYVNQTPKEILDIDDDYVISIYESNLSNDFKNYAYFNSSLEVIAKVKNSPTLLNYLSNEILPINLAQQTIGVEEITEDEVVLTAFEFKLNDLALQPNNNEELMTLNKSLLSLAINRKSNLLMNYIETKFPEVLGTFNNVLPIDDCYKLLAINSASNDFEIITKFQNLFHEKDIRVMRQCLRSLNSFRSSKILNYYVRTGKIDSSLLPVEEWPAGLANIGNTCYLNSLLQYYFSIKPIRDMILSFDEQKEIKTDRKIGGRKIDETEIQRSNQFIYQLQKLFQEMIETNQRWVSPSKDLAFLSFLPSSQPVNFITNISENNSELNPLVIKSDTSSITDMDMNNEEKEIKEQADLIQVNSTALVDDDNDDDNSMIEDQAVETEKSNVHEESEMEQDEKELDNRLDEDSSMTTPEEIETSKILPINTKDMESTINLGGQQDVTECIENVNFQIETALEPINVEDDGEQYDLIKQLFYGKIKQTIEPLDGGSGELRSSIERFSSLIINVSDHPKDIYDALDNYFNADIVKLESGNVKKSLTIEKLPDILQFQVQRVLFDREKLVAYKSIESIPFYDRIYVDRFLDTTDTDILNKREEVFNWKSKIKQLEADKSEILKINSVTNLSIIDSLITTKTYLQSIMATDDSNLIESNDSLESNTSNKTNDSKDSKTEIHQETIDYISNEIEKLKSKINTIDVTINELHDKIANQFNNYKKVGYSIFAIFIHRGEASFGHYWIYIKDPHNKDVYRKYNDDSVTEVPSSEIFKFDEGNTATPYYIAYVKDDLEQDYVQPLKRVINNNS